MKKKNTTFILILLVVMLLLASCEMDTLRSSQDPTAAQTTATAAETTETMMPPTETTVTISTEKIVFEKDEPYMNVWTCSFLLQKEKAFVFDNSIRDGLQAQAGFTETELPEGTIIADLNEFRPDHELYPGKTLFILPDDRCVFFEQSATDSGEPIFNGKPVKDFMRGQNYDYDYFEAEPKVVENYELLPDTPLDPSVAPKKYSHKRRLERGREDRYHPSRMRGCEEDMGTEGLVYGRRDRKKDRYHGSLRSRRYGRVRRNYQYYNAL